MGVGGRCQARKNKGRTHRHPHPTSTQRRETGMHHGHSVLARSVPMGYSLLLGGNLPYREPRRTIRRPTNTALHVSTNHGSLSSATV